MNDTELIAALRQRKRPEDLERADYLEWLGRAAQSRIDAPRGSLNPEYFDPHLKIEEDDEDE